MAETTGFVQALSIVPDMQLWGGQLTIACFLIGPAPRNAEQFFVIREDGDTTGVGAFKASMVDALVTAQVHRKEVTIRHPDEGGTIMAVLVPPA